MLKPLLLKRAVMATLQGVLLGAALTLAGCSAGSEEEGRIRVTPAQIVGGCELKLGKGAERLELKADGTYTQTPFRKLALFITQDSGISGSISLLGAR
jgi:hypothetical protein